MTNLTEKYYQALIARDLSYEGIIVAAVKTTGVFCRLTCRARKPKKENVEFFRNAEDAMFRGYRPCKVCTPLEPLDEVPIYIKNILDEILSAPSVKIKDCDLRSKGVEPYTVRRWFMKNYGITFHAYQRMICLYNAFREIQTGKSVTFAAFDAGYESLSGFNDSFKSIFGIAPSCSRSLVDSNQLEILIGTTLLHDFEQRLNNKGSKLITKS